MIPQFGYQPRAALDAVRDPYFANVVLLVANDNKANGTTSFADQSASAHVMTANGNAQYDTASAPTGMTSSMLLDGVGDYLTTPDSADWAFGSGDWTVEYMIRFGNVVATQQAISQENGATGAGAWTSAPLFGTDKSEFYYTTDGTVGTRRDMDNTSWSPGTVSFHHIAICRNGVNGYVFLDGTQHGATFNCGADTLADSALQLCIGADSAGNFAVNGRMSNIRITKGVARYTANFTPPTLPMPAQ